MLKNAFRKYLLTFREKKKIKSRIIYSNNFYNRKNLRRTISIWKVFSKNSLKQKIEEEYSFQIEKKRANELTQLENEELYLKKLIEDFNLKFLEIEEMKKKLTAEYEAALNRGISKLSIEAQSIVQSKMIVGLLTRRLL